MGRPETQEEPRAERRVLPITGTVQYLEMDDLAGVGVSVHTSAMKPGNLFITGLDRRKDYRPIRLDRDRIVQLRDALNLALADLT